MLLLLLEEAEMLLALPPLLKVLVQSRRAREREELHLLLLVRVRHCLLPALRRRHPSRDAVRASQVPTCSS